MVLKIRYCDTENILLIEHGAAWLFSTSYIYHPVHLGSGLALAILNHCWFIFSLSCAINDNFFFAKLLTKLQCLQSTQVICPMYHLTCIVELLLFFRSLSHIQFGLKPSPSSSLPSLTAWDHFRPKNCVFYSIIQVVNRNIDPGQVLQNPVDTFFHSETKLSLCTYCCLTSVSQSILHSSCVSFIQCKWQ